MFPVRVGFVGVLCCGLIVCCVCCYLFAFVVGGYIILAYFGSAVCSCVRFCGVRCLLNAGFDLCCYSWYC